VTSGGDIYIYLEGPKRAMTGVQSSTGACQTCDELRHYTNNCQRSRGNYDPQHDQGQPGQRGARGLVDTWAGTDFRIETVISISIFNWTPNNLTGRDAFYKIEKKIWCSPRGVYFDKMILSFQC